jgi:hypothetical protein
MDDNELERMWKKLLWSDIGIFLEGLRETVKWSRLANFPSRFETEDLTNVNEELYRYAAKYFET